MEKEKKPIDDDKKKQIFKLMATPGVKIKNVAEQMDIGYERLMKFLEDEYMKHNLGFGRRLCCRFS
ncbi:MAG: hypothetical protein R6U96_17260 [Promethearchaeia archaeon]